MPSIQDRSFDPSPPLDTPPRVPLAAGPHTRGTHGRPASDGELIAAARTGDTAAYGELFQRHENAVRRIARCVRRRSIEDLVLSAYTRGFDALRSSNGPTTAFRAYLLGLVMADETTHECRAIESQTLTDHYERSSQPYRLTADPVAHDGSEVLPGADCVLETYAAMQEEWQLLLWHGDVEGEQPAQLALLLGCTTEEAFAARRRARGALRQFTASQYLGAARPGRCRYVVDRLAGFMNDELDVRDSARVDGHLDRCENCAGLLLQLRTIDDHLPGILARSVLGPYAEGYLDRSVLPRPGGVRFRRLLQRGHGVATAGIGAALGVVLAVLGVNAMLDSLGGAASNPPGEAWSSGDMPRPGAAAMSSSTPAPAVDNDSPGNRPAGGGQTGGTDSNRARGPEPFGGALGIPSLLPAITEPPLTEPDSRTPADRSEKPGSPDPTPTGGQTTRDPSEPPSDEPTTPPTDGPTDEPTTPPTDSPTSPPTDTPTNEPTSPSPSPTAGPTADPTQEPTSTPTSPSPSSTPTGEPEHGTIDPPARSSDRQVLLV